MLSLGYGCGLRAGEIVRHKDGDFDSVQMIIWVVQSKGRKVEDAKALGISIASAICRANLAEQDGPKVTSYVSGKCFR